VKETIRYDYIKDGFRADIHRRPALLFIAFNLFLLWQWFQFFRMSGFLVSRFLQPAHDAEKFSSLVLAVFFVPITLLSGFFLLRWLLLELIGWQRVTVIPGMIIIQEKPFGMRRPRQIEVRYIEKIGLGGPTLFHLERSMMGVKPEQPDIILKSARLAHGIFRFLQAAGMAPAITIFAEGKEQGIHGIGERDAQELLTRMSRYLPKKLFAAEKEMESVWQQRNLDND
jgi:hypothetical protein